MKESVLKKFFGNQIPARQLAEDLKDSQQRTGFDTISITIESMQAGRFELSKEDLIKLCDSYLNREITSTDLNTIAYALICSEFFTWDDNTKSGERIDQVVFDWDNESIGYDINHKNVLLWKEYLETGNSCLDENELKLKFRSKGKWKTLYQAIDEILWTAWDPLGINDVAPRDEYQSHTPIIFGLKRQDATEEEISGKLYEIETETMGLFGNHANCQRVAKIIIALGE